MMLFWLLACTSEQPKSTTETEKKPEIQAEASNEIPETKKGQDVSAVKVSDTGMDLKLPSIESGRAKRKQCFLQEMPEADVGITGVTYETRGQGLNLIRLRAIENSIGNDMGRWVDCETLGSGYFSKPVIEITGVDLEKTKKKPFNGMDWVNLPDGVAFSYPGNVWVFEAWLADEAKDVEISISLETIPESKVKHFAGVVEMDLGSPSGDQKQSFTCPWQEEVKIVSVLGYADPAAGSFTVSCDEKEVYSVDSKAFASDPPPVGNFSDPVVSSDSCTVTCEWPETWTGAICTASIVAYPLDRSSICVNGGFQ